MSLTLAPLAALCFIISNVTGGASDWWSFHFEAPQWSFLVPALFAATVVGIAVLCIYSLSGIKPDAVDHKEHVAVLLAGLGFTYQVIGAWPMWSASAYPWSWQVEIAKYGVLLVLSLFAVSLTAFIVSAASLYMHSRIWHQKQAETDLA